MVRREVITPEQLAWAIEAARGSRRTWLEELLLFGVLDECLLCRWVSSELHVPCCNATVLAELRDDVLQMLPADVAVEHRALPLGFEADGDLHVAMIDPCDAVALEELRFFTGRRLVREVAVATAVAWALHRYYGARTALWPRHGPTTIQGGVGESRSATPAHSARSQ